MKPLTTLGDALAAKGADVDWRAELRANEIPRRAPPSSSKPPPSAPPPQTLAEAIASRPDRGYVEQPEERINTTTVPPRTQRRREETPTLSTPVALIRLNYEQKPATALDAVLAHYAAENPPPPPAEEPVVPKGVKKLAADGRRLFTPEFRAEVLAAFDAGQLKDPPLTQKSIADKFDVHQTLLSGWIRKRAEERAAAEKEAKRQATRAANKAAKSSEQTLLSRPSPPSGPARSAVQSVRVASGQRDIETVSRELAEAMARVAELKAEMRALLGD